MARKSAGDAGHDGTPSLAEELERLERIVRQLEADDLDLDAAMALFEEGVRRLQAARHRLEEAELQVRQVLQDADGTLRATDLDA